jgi:hypothetical protein
VIVLDPLSDPDWPCDFKTKDKHEFLEVVKSNQECILFIDESGQEIGRYNDEMFFLATQSRHWGHISYFISQRAQSINKTVRDQCSNLYAFCLSKTDGDILYNEYCQEELKKIHLLPKYHFYMTGRFKTPKLVKL